MCKYCDLKNYEYYFHEKIHDGLILSEYIPQIAIGYAKETKTYHIMSSYGWSTENVQIHYCPFCGRKLEE